MSLDPTWLFLSLFPSGLGFVLLTYGRKQGRWPYAVGGLALLIYPYFVTSITMLMVVGLVIGALVWYAAAE
ncbi:MAG: hypothetical protein U0Q11_05500 [Vicinamibacterales bacterium]